MFELIGIAVVGWIGWVIVKTILAVKAKETLKMAVHFARMRGVPTKEALAIINFPSLLKETRKSMADGNNDFASLDVSQQYGAAIADIYEEKLKAEDFPRKKELIKDFIATQIAVLEAEGARPVVNHITFVYVFALALGLQQKGRGGINLGNIKEIIEYIFKGESYEFGIMNSWGVCTRASNFHEMVAAMMAVTQKELAAGQGDFYVKHTRKHHREIELMFEPIKERVDLSKVNPMEFLNVD